jgi:hypothetical protein
MYFKSLFAGSENHTANVFYTKLQGSLGPKTFFNTQTGFFANNIYIREIADMR